MTEEKTSNRFNAKINTGVNVVSVFNKYQTQSQDQSNYNYTTIEKYSAILHDSSSELKSRKTALIRAYDVFFSLVIFAVFLIPTCILAFIKLLIDGRPLFYNSYRTGKDGVSIKVFKFRSMINDQKYIKNYLAKIETHGFEKIPVDCELYTPMGRFFEKFQIVEILQIFNVLRGEMSLIGYRPMPANRIQELKHQYGENVIALRHSVLPGITGFSQIIGKTNLSNKERITVENYYNIFVQTQPQIKVVYLNSLIIAETIAHVILKRSFFMNIINKMIINSAELSIVKK